MSSRLAVDQFGIKWWIRHAVLPSLVLSLSAVIAIALINPNRTPGQRSRRKVLKGGLQSMTIPVKVGDYEDGQLITRQVDKSVVIDTLTGGVELEMMEIPEGEFLMGEDSAGIADLVRECAGYYAGSKCDQWPAFMAPQHRVTIKSFLIGSYEVTQRQWKAVMGDLPPAIGGPGTGFRGDDLPVFGVSWDDIQVFLAKLGRGYRLPTEAEWEYAARAGTTTPYAFGLTITPEIVNYNGNSLPITSQPRPSRSAPVVTGSLGLANRFGLYDMHGNVSEWCQDAFHDNYDGAPLDGREWKDDSPASLRVIRGGNWAHDANGCRIAVRYCQESASPGQNVGFRLARALP